MTEQVRSINVDYIDSGRGDLASWATDPDTLVVPNAGDDLCRRRSGLARRHRLTPRRDTVS
jgi:hypothetical protein